MAWSRLRLPGFARQGLSVGGEYIGSMSFLVEHADKDRRALQGQQSNLRPGAVGDDQLVS